jgi:hypothetical protein
VLTETRDRLECGGMVTSTEPGGEESRRSRGASPGLRCRAPGTSASGARGRGRSCQGWGGRRCAGKGELRRCRGRATSAAAQIRAANRRCRGSGALGVLLQLRVARGEATDKRRGGGGQPRRAGRLCNGPRASRGLVMARSNPSAGGLLEGREGSGAGQWDHASAGERAQGCGGAGPRAVAERPAVWEKNRGEEGEGGRRC